MTLEQRIARVLAQLSQLSEAPAARLGQESGRRKHESKVPSGAHLSLVLGAPSKDRSLYDFYVWQFENTRPVHLRERLLNLAEVDLELRLKRNPRPHKEEPTETRDARILSWYENMPAEKAAAYEECSLAHIRKLRSRHGRHPSDGRLRENGQAA